MGKGFPMGVGGGADVDVVTAKSGDVLSGKVIVGPDGEPLTGNMPNRGNVSHSLPINGSYTIPNGYHAGSGRVSQSVATKGAQTFTPGRSNQSISANQWLSGAQTIIGDPNLVSGNIREGVTLFGTRGSLKYIPQGPSDLYNRGGNYASVKPFGSGAVMDSSQISSSSPTAIQIQIVLTASLSGYSKLNVISYTTEANKMNVDLYRGTTEMSSSLKIASSPILSTQAGVEFTHSVDISAAQISSGMILVLWRITRTKPFSIRRIWLS